MPSSSKCLLSLRSLQIILHTLLSLCTFQMPPHFSPSPFNQPNIIQSAVLIMKLPTMQSPAVNCPPVPLNHKYLPQHSILRHPQFMFLPQNKATSFMYR